MSRYIIRRDGFRKWAVYDRMVGFDRIRLTSRRACERAIADVAATAVVAARYAAQLREAVSPANGKDA